MAENLHTINQVCERLSLSRSTFYRLRDEGKLKAVKIGRATRVPESSIEQFINELGGAA